MVPGRINLIIGQFTEHGNGTENGIRFYIRLNKIIQLRNRVYTTIH